MATAPGPQSGCNVDELFRRGEQIVQEAQFIISSLPNVDEPSVRRSLYQLLALDNSLATLHSDPFTTQDEMDGLRNLVQQLALTLHGFLDTPPERQTAHVEDPSGPGQPRHVLDLTRALELHNLGGSWNKVAQAMGTTRQTLYNHLKAAGLNTARPAFTQILDDDLDEVVARISLDHPLAGASMIHGLLQSRNIIVPVLRVQESLRRVDAIGVLLWYVAL